jgi:hypothetical protein
MKSFVAVFVGLALQSAQAASLYWASTPVKTSSVRTCIAFAGDAMRLTNMQNIRRQPNEVAGTTGGTYAAITCLATGSRATAMVMTAGDNGAETQRVRDMLRAKIAGMTNFD